MYSVLINKMTLCWACYVLKDWCSERENACLLVCKISQKVVKKVVVVKEMETFTFKDLCPFSIKQFLLPEKGCKLYYRILLNNCKNVELPIRNK